MQAAPAVLHRSGILRRCTGCSLQVYKAVRNGVQVVAVKIFTDQVAGENQARYTEAFRREIFILRSCHDRNIVQFLGACLQVRPPPTKHPLRCARLCEICRFNRMSIESPGDEMNAQAEGIVRLEPLSAHSLLHTWPGTQADPARSEHEQLIACMVLRRSGRPSWCRSTWRTGTCTTPSPRTCPAALGGTARSCPAGGLCPTRAWRAASPWTPRAASSSCTPASEALWAPLALERL